MNEYLKLQDINQIKEMKLSIELVKEIGKICSMLPHSESHIKDQISRSSSSVMQNITKAEQGYKRVKFSNYSTALGSAQETKSLILNCVRKGLITEGKYLKVDITIEKLINMLNQQLTSLRDAYPHENFPQVKIQNIETIPVFQKAQTLVKRLMMLTDDSFSDWHTSIIKTISNSSCSISSHVSESEQAYISNKRKFLTYAYQESNVVRANLMLLEEYISDVELYEDLMKLAEEISFELQVEIEQMANE